MRAPMRAAALLTAALAAGAPAAQRPAHDHGRGAAACPVMGGAIRDRASAPKLRVNNVPVYFCCPPCPAALKKEPAKYLKQPLKDPVTGKPFRVTARTPKLEHAGGLFLFSSPATLRAFRANPTRYGASGARAPSGAGTVRR